MDAMQRCSASDMTDTNQRKETVILSAITAKKSSGQNEIRGKCCLNEPDSVKRNDRLFFGKGIPVD